jgi:hypothetical protein
MGSILPLQRELSKKFSKFQAPFFQGGANSKSKIVRLNFDRLSYRADSELVELHAEVQNPKSGDHLVENAKLLFFYHKFS